MPTAYSLSQVAGIDVAADLPFGVLGEGFIGLDGTILKLLRPGELPPDGACDELAAIAYEPVGEEDGRQALALIGKPPELTPLGVLVGGTRLQGEAVRLAEVFDPDQRLARRLRLTDVPGRGRLLASFARSLTKLHASGQHVTVITPWNVVVKEGRLALLDGVVTLDPTVDGFDAAAIHDDAKAFLAPEVVAAIGAGKTPPASAAADVYAWAATTRAALLNRIAPATFEHSRYSAALEDLLDACLAQDPSRRPDLASANARFEKLLDGNGLDYSAPAAWVGAVNTALAIVLILGLCFVFRDEFIQSQEEVAWDVFLRASRITNIEERDAALADAIVFQDGDRQLIPAAKRLQALDGFLLWQSKAAKDPKELDAVLTGLEDVVIASHKDELADAARVVVGFLRRWELGEEGGRQHGDHLLEQSARSASSPALRGLAAAARALTACGVEETNRDSAWSDAALQAASDEGSLTRPLPLAKEGGSISLESGWIGRLVAGRLIALDGGSDALSHLRAAQSSATFSSESGLALELLRTGSDLDEAGKILGNALSHRDCVELRLAQARLTLAQAHQGNPVAYAKAESLFEAVGEKPSPSDNPGAEESIIRRVAAEGAHEAAFYAALALLGNPQSLPQAELALASLLTQNKNNREWKKRYQADTRIALGVCLVKLGKAADASQDLRCAFVNRDPRSGWAQLPDLEPTPHTRDRAFVLRYLVQPLLAELGQVRKDAQTDQNTASITERDLRVSLGDLLALEETPQALGPAYVARTRAEMELTRAIVSRSGKWRALEGARRSYVEARAASDPSDPGWAQCQRGLIEVYTRQRKEGRGDLQQLAPLLYAAADLDGLSASPAPTASALKKELQGLVDGLARDLPGFIQARAGAWGGINVRESRLGGDKATVLLERLALERSLKLLGTPSDAKLRRKAAEQQRYLALLLWTQNESACVDAAAAGLKLLGDGESTLAKELNFLLGAAATIKPTLVEPRLKTVGYTSTRALGRDGLARAMGAKDYAAFWKSASRGKFKPVALDSDPKGPAMLMARSLLSEHLPQVPANVRPDQPLPKKSSGLERIFWVAASLDTRNPDAQLALARVRLAGSAKDGKRLGQAATGAKRALALNTSEDAAGLALTAEAARTYCMAEAARGGDAALAKAQDAAMRGANAATQMGMRFSEELSRGSASAAVYWAGRVYLAKGRQGNSMAMLKAAESYQTFGRLLGQGTPPPEAKSWKKELAEAEKGGKK